MARAVAVGRVLVRLLHGSLRFRAKGQRQHAEMPIRPWRRNASIVQRRGRETAHGGITARDGSAGIAMASQYDPEDVVRQEGTSSASNERRELSVSTGLFFPRAESGRWAVEPLFGVIGRGTILVIVSKMGGSTRIEKGPLHIDRTKEQAQKWPFLRDFVLFICSHGSGTQGTGEALGNMTRL